MITGSQIVAHMFGDYVLQSDWMAGEKTKKSVAAFAHAFVYTLCFIPFVIDFKAENIAMVLGVIGGTHFVIDRWRLARYVVYAKNFLAPRDTGGDVLVNVGSKHRVPARTIFPEKVAQMSTVDGRRLVDVYFKWWHPWEECKGTGYHKDRPPWLSVWLLIAADNAMHLLINGLALHYLGS